MAACQANDGNGNDKAENILEGEVAACQANDSGRREDRSNRDCRISDFGCEDWSRRAGGNHFYRTRAISDGPDSHRCGIGCDTVIDDWFDIGWGGEAFGSVEIENTQDEENTMKKRALAVVLTVVIAMGLAACGGGIGESSGDTRQTIRVGSKDFTENLVVSEIYALALEDAGYEVERVQNISGSVIHTSIVNLQAHASEIRFASQGEFNEREDAIPALEKVYGAFDWKSSKVYDNGLKYELLEKGEADACPAYTTEGQLIETGKFTLLEDDKHVWPPYNLAPVVQDKILAEHPDIAGVLNAVSETLDTETVTALNAKIDVEKEEMEDVAREYYESIQ